MTQHDEMDITSWLQSEGRRLAGPFAKNPPRPGLGSQQQATCFDPEPVVTLVKLSAQEAPAPGSLSEVLRRMALEKQTRSRIR